MLEMLLVLNKNIKTFKKLILTLLFLIILKIIFYETIKNNLTYKELSENEEVDEIADQVKFPEKEYIKELEQRYRELNEEKIDLKCKLSQYQDQLEVFYDKYQIIQELVRAQNEMDTINDIEIAVQSSHKNYFSVLQNNFHKENYYNVQRRYTKAILNYYGLKLTGNRNEALKKVEEKLQSFITKVTEVNHELLTIEVSMRTILNEIDFQKI